MQNQKYPVMLFINHHMTVAYNNYILCCSANFVDLVKLVNVMDDKLDAHKIVICGESTVEKFREMQKNMEEIDKRSDVMSGVKYVICNELLAIDNSIIDNIRKIIEKKGYIGVEDLKDENGQNLYQLFDNLGFPITP